MIANFLTRRAINLNMAFPYQELWQRHYYEHIIRNKREMDRITRYIESNLSSE